MALVLTVDFFTPVVDDPFDYGRVAAANSLSDVYAMGGEPMVALNIAGFPEGEIDDEVCAEILKGGAAVAQEASTVIIGGHTVSDKEVKYGLSVVGRVHPDRVIENAGAELGDVLILTKALGTGVLTTALKAEDLSSDEYGALIASMTHLNRDASVNMRKYETHACTDITGNGLIGHAFELAKASNVVVEFDTGNMPLLPGTLPGVEKGYLTAGDGTNREYTRGYVEWGTDVNKPLEHVLYDPQTSGGLLITVRESDADKLLADLKRDHNSVAIIGRVVEKGKTLLRLV